MECEIIETGEIKILNIVDRATGIEWTQDLIGNAGAITDGQFEWSDGDNAYLVSQDNYDWWEQYIGDYADTEDDIVALSEYINCDPSEIFWRIHEEAYGADYGDHRKNAIRVLNEILEENK